ncbi:Uncharacterised protein [Escherichia coli]|nr:Uncharacterised protein [Escherichia coli]
MSCCASSLRLGLSRPSPRRYGASSAFPTLTGLVALAAGLAAVYGLQTRQKRRRSRVRDTAAAGVVDTSRKTWPSLTDEGADVDT